MPSPIAMLLIIQATGWYSFFFLPESNQLYIFFGPLQIMNFSNCTDTHYSRVALIYRILKIELPLLVVLFLGRASFYAFKIDFG